MSSASAPLSDDVGRRYRKLRLSVTDRCQLRCRYCMPDGPTAGWLPREQILDYEAMAEFVALLAPLGINDVRITGGEPLVRRGVHHLVRQLRALPQISRITLTSNGIALPSALPALLDAGLDGATVSLDSLESSVFATLSGGADLASVLAGVACLAAAPLKDRKLNAVVVRGINDHEVCDLVRFAADRGLEMRFIELMPFGTHWRPADVVRADEIVSGVCASLGPATELPVPHGNTARRWRLADGSVFGVVPTLSGPLCSECDRLRLSADGKIHNCLFDATGASVRDALLAHDDDAVLATVRAHLMRKGAGYVAARLQDDGTFFPLAHMHQVGG